MRNPFDLTDAVIRDLPHVKVTRHAPRAGRHCEYRKVFHPRKLGNARYWIERENEFLLEFALKKLKHVVEFAQVSRGGEDAPVVEAVTTRDAGVTLEDWLRVRPQYAGGDTLKHPFRHAGVFLELLRACLLALQEIHALGIVHCDIKEDNICLPYSPYPWQAGTRIHIDFARLKLIDFAFSVSAERPLLHRLPIEPKAPYQSNLLKSALQQDCSAALEDGLQAQRVDWRVDLYSLGYLAGKIFATKLLSPQGRAGYEALEGAGRLVDRLKAFDHSDGGELPHAGLIAEIDALLAPLTDLEDYRWFGVDGLQDAAPYPPAPLTPLALGRTEGEGPAETSATPIAAVETRPLTSLGRTLSKGHVDEPRNERPRRGWLSVVGLLLSGLGLAWAMPNGHLDWTGLCSLADRDLQIRECRLWPGEGPLLWQGPTRFSFSPPALPSLADQNQVASADRLLALGVAAGQYRIGDKLKIHYALARPLYLRLLVVNSSGQVETLYPESGTADQPVEAGKIHAVDGLEIGGPAGSDRLIALASDSPLPLSGLVDSEGRLSPQALALAPTVVRLSYQVVGRWDSQ